MARVAGVLRRVHCPCAAQAGCGCCGRDCGTTELRTSDNWALVWLFASRIQRLDVECRGTRSGLEKEVERNMQMNSGLGQSRITCAHIPHFTFQFAVKPGEVKMGPISQRIRKDLGKYSVSKNR